MHLSWRSVICGGNSQTLTMFLMHQNLRIVVGGSNTRVKRHPSRPRFLQHPVIVESEATFPWLSIISHDKIYENFLSKMKLQEPLDGIGRKVPESRW